MPTETWNFSQQPVAGCEHLVAGFPNRYESEPVRSTANSKPKGLRLAVRGGKMAKRDANHSVLRNVLWYQARLNTLAKYRTALPAEGVNGDN